MNWIRTAVALSALAFGAASAGDAINKTKTSTKTEKTTTTDPAGAFNSTTDSAKLEKDSKALKDGRTESSVESTAKHDAPGMKNDRESTTKTTTVKDANGKVIQGSHEQTIK
ncbi:MAG: hypothetical protein ACT4TC_26810 [Myxococcaceae bacterium]